MPSVMAEKRLLLSVLLLLRSPARMYYYDTGLLVRSFVSRYAILDVQHLCHIVTIKFSGA